MKKYASVFLIFLLLAGCSNQPDEMEIGLELRSKLLQSAGCSFEAEIQADYGDKLHTFTMECDANPQGEISFTVIKPDTISGISGKLSGEGGNIAFDDTALHFALLTEDRISPISAPWIVLNTLRSGCITSCCLQDGSVRLSIDDSYEDDALRLDIWLDSDNIPQKADILYNGLRFLSVFLEGFEIL